MMLLSIFLNHGLLRPARIQFCSIRKSFKGNSICIRNARHQDFKHSTFCKDFTVGICRYSFHRNHNSHAFTTLCQARYPTPSFVPTFSILVTCQTLSFIIILPFVTPPSSTCRQLLYRLSLFCQMLRHSLQLPPLSIVNKATWF